MSNYLNHYVNPYVGTGSANGAQGAQGTAGAQGSAGSQGAQGSQGATGAGSQGAQGFQGTTGPQGFQGNTGGAQGSQGAQGAAGPQGSQGVAGSNGAQGSQGAQGFQGLQGFQGTTGSQGSQGAQGSNPFGSSVTSSAGSGSQSGTTYTDLSTPAVVTITTGTKALVILHARCNTDTSGGGVFISVRVSGSSTIASAANHEFGFVFQSILTSTPEDIGGIVIPFGTGGDAQPLLTAGSNTFTAQLRANVTGTATCSEVLVTVVPLN